MSDQQLDSEFTFDLPKNKSSVIKVIGVGGGGSNAVNHMKNTGIKGVDFIICNTDAQALYHSPVEIKIQLGVALTEGLGAGANPEVGQQAAVENIDEIKNILGKETKMLFITAGMGGGTGTGAAPVIAKTARDLGILTVGIVTNPFKFEGSTRQKQAEKGIDQLRNHVDSLIVINNNKLREVYGNLGFKAGFAKADEVLANAAKGIAEVITHHYTANIDLKDARTVLANSGSAIMGSGKASGEDRAVKAIHDALDSPLLNDNQIIGAKNVLLLIVSGSDENEITFDEIGEITDFIQSEAGGDANIIMGIGDDNQLGHSIGITIVATGFNQDQQVKVINKEPEKVVHPLEEDQEVTRGIFEKPLAIEPNQDQAIKPEKSRLEDQEPTDLFSQLPSAAPVQEKEEQELSLEVELTETHRGQQETPEELSHNAVSTHEAEEEDSTKVVFELTDDAIEWVMDSEDDSEQEKDTSLEAAEGEMPVSAEATIPEGQPLTESSMESTVQEEESRSDEVAADFAFEMIDLDEENPEAQIIEDEISAETTQGLADTETSFAAEEMELRQPLEEEESKVAFSLDGQMPEDSMEDTLEASDTSVKDSEGTPEEPISYENQNREDQEPIKRYTLEDLEAFKETLDSRPQTTEDSTESKGEEEVQFQIKTVEPAMPLEPRNSVSEMEVDPFDASIEESVKKKQDERKKRLEAFNYQFQSAKTNPLDAEAGPAYKRRGIEVSPDPVSNQSTMGNMSVSGDSDSIEIRTNNSFLHDNVD
mgnify:CR=1 FL=1